MELHFISILHKYVSLLSFMGRTTDLSVPENIWVQKAYLNFMQTKYIFIE